MRGEKEKAQNNSELGQGSPPRARGKGGYYRDDDGRAGITPACAGKSSSKLIHLQLDGDHPRVRGEKTFQLKNQPCIPGSPPRARGKELVDDPLGLRLGITPACAGKSPAGQPSPPPSGDHPRVRGEKWREIPVSCPDMGSPPRARGKAVVESGWGLHAGITPACAGKSSIKFWAETGGGDHPRVRGEKRFCPACGTPVAGSPPRARGKVHHHRNGQKRSGITPACAGKSRILHRQPSPLWDHPRVRGEKQYAGAPPQTHAGSPPRARGKEQGGGREESEKGITPACAGKRLVRTSAICAARDHPRVRGEKGKTARPSAWLTGSPPRARGKELANQAHVSVSRITPACAGKSHTDRGGKRMDWDHPRVRGEKRSRRRPGSSTPGSPPRARGKVTELFDYQRAAGITPACAGKSNDKICLQFLFWDHPRVRGEKAIGKKIMMSQAGSPPRARGKVAADRAFLAVQGITPACAGKSSLWSLSAKYKWDHPRVRGEKILAERMRPAAAGSPPRARGKVAYSNHPSFSSGITPACAGKRTGGRLRPPCARDHPRVRGEKK